MKKIIFIILTCLGSSCSLPSAGTLGGWDTSVFPVNEQNMESNLAVFFQKYPKFKVPSEKKYIVDYWKKAGYGFLKGMFFYFNTEPARVYYVTYIDAGFGAENPEYARIALRAVYNENTDRWSIHDDLKKEQQDSIREKFNNEIILRLEQVIKKKSYIEPKDY